MKKLLAILGAVGLTATGTSSVVACDKSNKNSGEISQLTFVDGKSVKDLEVLMIDGKIFDGKVVADSAQLKRAQRVIQLDLKQITMGIKKSKQF